MANIQDLVENYSRLAADGNMTKQYGPDETSSEAVWLTGFVNKLHPRRIRMRVTDKFSLTDTTTAFHLSPVDQYLPPFQAGQYIEIFIERDGLCTGRAYSIASSPEQRSYYEIAVRRKGDGLVSNFLIDQVKIGDVLETSAPAGNLYFNPVFHKKEQVLIAGGTGITPFISMIREVTDKGLDRSLHLIYGSRTPEDVPYLEELKDRAAKHDNFRFNLVISDENAVWEGERGFISADLIRRLVKNPDEVTFYICGPHVMQTFLTGEFEKLAVPKKRIRRELVGAPQNICEEVGWPEEVSADQRFTVTYGDRTFEARANESVLTALERAGILHISCCRSGECSLCRMKLLDGKVYQSTSAILRKADQRDGYIHVCASYPVSDIVLAD